MLQTWWLKIRPLELQYEMEVLHTHQEPHVLVLHYDNTVQYSTRQMLENRGSKPDQPQCRIVQFHFTSSTGVDVQQPFG